MKLEELLKTTQVQVGILQLGTNEEVNIFEYQPNEFKEINKELLKKEVMETILEGDDYLEIWIR
jgi:hypothetical protein